MQEKKKKSNMRLITVYLPRPYIELLDKLKEMKYIPSRAEGIRVAVRDFIDNDSSFAKLLYKKLESKLEGQV